MKLSQLAIYSGLLIIFMSMGNDSVNVIPSWLGYTIGGVFLTYGILKEYKVDRKLKFKLFDKKINWLNYRHKFIF